LLFSNNGVLRMIDFTDEKRIIGWNSPLKDELLKLKGITIDNHFDKFNRSNWLWLDYPDGAPVYIPQPYTDEQLEHLRKEWCEVEIRKAYSVSKEAQIIRQAIGGNTSEYDAYNAAIEAIIAESMTKDFQIE